MSYISFKLYHLDYHAMNSALDLFEDPPLEKLLWKVGATRKAIGIMQSLNAFMVSTMWYKDHGAYRVCNL